MFLFYLQVNGQSTTVGLETVQVFSKENVGLRQQRGFHTLPRRSHLQTVTKSIDLEDDKELKIQPRGKASNPARMLSSSVVTVLAPHWSGRLRRNKRLEGSGNTETKDGTSSQAQQTQEPTDVLLTDRLQGQLRVPLMATKWNTVGDSKGNEQKKSVIQTGSLDASLGMSENFKRESSILETGQRKHSHTNLRTGLLSTSSKPTTSSLLLSLRRCNCNGRTPPASPLHSDSKHFPSSTLHGDQTEPTTRQDLKTFSSLPSRSYRTPETGTVFSSSSVDTGSTTSFETSLLSVPPIKKNTSFAQESQKTLSGSISSPQKSLYELSPLHKRSLPQRTTLTSTSWWKQVTQDSCSPSRNFDQTERPSVTPTTHCTINTTVSDTAVKGETPHLKLEKTNNLPNQRTDSLKERYVSNVNARKQQHPQSLTSHSSNPSHHVLHSYTTNLNQSPPNLPSFKSKETPCEISTKFNTNRISSSHNNIISFQNDSQSYTKLSPPISIANNVNGKLQTTQAASTVPASTKSNNSPLFPSKPVDLQLNLKPVSVSCSQPSKFTKSVDMIPLGFERSYSANPVPFHSKPCRISILAKANSVQHSPEPTACTLFSSTSTSRPATMPAPSSSHLTQPTNHTLTCSPTTISSLLTPPATPIITSPNPTSPNEGKTLLYSLEKDTNNLSDKSKKKRERRVTWDDSVDRQCSDSDTVEKAEQSQVLSPTRSSVTIKAPSIFSFLRQRDVLNTNRLHSPTPKSSVTQVTKSGKCRSYSSDAMDSPSTQQRSRERSQDINSDCLEFDKKNDFTPTHGRTLSMESGTTHYRHSVPRSLPTDFSTSYKHRYSSPPYTALVTSRSTHGDTENHKTIAPRSLLSRQTSIAKSNSTPKDTGVVKTLHFSRSMSSVSPQEPLSPHSQSKVSTRESDECGTLDKLENDHSTNISQDSHKSKIMLINNRVHIYSRSLPSETGHGSYPALVTETLVYSFEPKEDSTTAASDSTTMTTIQTPFQKTPNAINFKTNLCQQTKTEQNKENSGQSQQGSSSGSSVGSQAKDRESLKNKVKDSMICKGKLFSVESNNEQVLKRGKKSSSTPSSTLLRSDSDRASKTNNKMDQVFNKLKQTFSTRRSEDDMSFLWKWKKNSQTPSVSSSSDVSSVSDVTAQTSKPIDKHEEKKRIVPTDRAKDTEDVYQWPQNKYIIVPPSDSDISVTGDVFFSWSDKPLPNTDQNKQVPKAEMISKRPNHLLHSPTQQQFHFYDDSVNDYKQTNEFLSCKDFSPGRNTSPSNVHPSQHGKPSSSPRSPFSPFSSLSPLSSLPTSDATDDSVFYSPKLQRRKESSSHCEAVQGYSLGNSRICRASTGPPCTHPLKDNECMSPSYADLKYGIEPGKSFSVSSVLSSRPSGPGRISTGSRHMSLGNLTESTLTCANTSKDFHTDWASRYNGVPSKKLQDYYASDSNRMRSRSLPRSFTRPLADWGPVPPIGHNTTLNSPHLWEPNRDPQYFHRDPEGPPTPPPTPPLSPVVRWMSKPSSVSSPTFLDHSGAQQQKAGISSRGNLASRSYTSGLGLFEENSDTSSDTTTDDEYYLQTGDLEEKETEL